MKSKLNSTLKAGMHTITIGVTVLVLSFGHSSVALASVNIVKLCDLDGITGMDCSCYNYGGGDMCGGQPTDALECSGATGINFPENVTCDPAASNTWKQYSEGPSKSDSLGNDGEGGTASLSTGYCYKFQTGTCVQHYADPINYIPRGCDHANAQDGTSGNRQYDAAIATDKACNNGEGNTGPVL